jgi:Zn-dependent peptidase ImmA (M78 family)/DNA-binding XRE family transcriptional regulator
MTQIQINLKKWRKIRGLTQEEVAQKAGVSRQGYMKLERGDSSPRTETLVSIANALDVAIPELIKEEPRWESLRFRTGKKETQKIKAERSQTLIIIREWLDFYNDIETDLEEKIVYRFKKIQSCLPKELASTVREIMNIGPKLPIPDMFELIEEAGIKLYLMNSTIPNLFGMSIGEKDGGPCIAVNTNNAISVERQIFTAAHELGHLLLHRDSYTPSDKPFSEEDNKEEKEANDFASHLLMPQDALENEWEDSLGINWIDRVLKVKKYFKVSYKTVLMRIVHEYEGGAENVYKSFNKGFQRKYNHDLKNHYEPESVAAQSEPQKTGIKDLKASEERFERLVRKAYEKNIISISKAGEMLKISPETMRDLADAWSEEPKFFG